MFSEITAFVDYTGDLRTQCRHDLSGATIVTDAPIDNHGKGEAFSPTDLFATSLGACALTIMGIAARTHNIDMRGAGAGVKKYMSTDLPRRVVAIEVNIAMPESDWSSKDIKILENAARNCPVMQSLHPDIKVDIRFMWS